MYCHQFTCAIDYMYKFDSSSNHFVFTCILYLSEGILILDFCNRWQLDSKVFLMSIFVTYERTLGLMLFHSESEFRVLLLWRAIGTFMVMFYVFWQLSSILFRNVWHNFSFRFIYGYGYVTFYTIVYSHVLFTAHADGIKHVTANQTFFQRIFWQWKKIQHFHDSIEVS